VLVSFVVDKSLIIKYHRRPPSTDASIPVYATDALIITTLIRIAISCWIFGIESMFVSELNSSSEMLIASSIGDLNFFSRITKKTSLPHVLLLLLLVSVLIARRILQFTLGSVVETVAYWLIPNDCCGRDPIQEQHRRDHAKVYKPPFTSIFGTIIKPLDYDYIKNVDPNKNKKITHKIPEKLMSNRGWCHVCKNTNFKEPCLDLRCTEWHYRRKRWLNNGSVNGLNHKIGDFAKTWEVIRENGLHSYRIQDNENYIHVMHLRNEERFESAKVD
jgi:hypothetical protein